MSIFKISRACPAFFPVLICLLYAVTVLLSIGCGIAGAAQGEVSVQAMVETDSVSLGEPFMMLIQVEGGEVAPGTQPPDTSGLTDFSVEYLGGRNNNSSSITIINGKMSRVETYGHTYSYRLTPRKVGRLVIPSIAVPVDPNPSRVLHTQPITVKVGEPEASEDFHLELKYSKTRFYVGEPVMVNVVWYLGKDVESVGFNLPIFRDPAFVFADTKTDQDPRKQYFQIQTEGLNILAEKGTADYNGRQFTTLSFQKVLYARKAGSFETPEASVSCKALVGYSQQKKRRGPFDSFFDDDFFSSGRKGVYKTFVSRSQPNVLTALELPVEGRPPDFSGWVGRFQLEASASPTEVSVGDPITLTLSVSGSDYLENLELPPLGKNPDLDKDFKVPEEMAAGVVKADSRQFTQTLRPRSAEVREIPALQFPFFNPDTGRYETARTRPIPITVKPARVLTSADVEGKSGDVYVKKSELENWSLGIAYNYEGPEVLERQTYRIAAVVRSPLWLTVTLAPFAAFATLLLITRVRERQLADPDRLKSRKALARFKQRLKALENGGLGSREACPLVLDAVRDYLADRLKLDGAAMSFADIEQPLVKYGMNDSDLERLRELFQSCELGSYGGMSLGRSRGELLAEALAVIQSLDQALKERKL